MPLLQEPRAEHIDGDVYREAQPDELKDSASQIVNMYNAERMADVMRIAAHELQVPFEEVCCLCNCCMLEQPRYMGRSICALHACGAYVVSLHACDNLHACENLLVAVLLAQRTLPEVSCTAVLLSCHSITCNGAALLALSSEREHRGCTRTSKPALCMQLVAAEMLWVDVNGMDFKGQTLTGRVATGRFEFRRKAIDDLDVLSLITMAAQEAWEIDRNYVPAMPEMAARSQA